MPKTNGISQTVKMKITLWAAAHKEKLKTLTIAGARELIKKEFGVNVAASSVKDIYVALEIDSRGNTCTKVHSAPSLQIRTLARILRNHLFVHGTDIPPALMGLCDGNAVAEGEHHVGNGAAK